MADALSTQLTQFLQQWNQGQPTQQSVVQAVVPLADETGDVRAQTMAAWVLGNSGDWARAAEYAERAIANGNVGLAQWMVPNLAGQTDAGLRQAAVRLASAAADAGLPLDFANMAHQMTNVGDLEAAAELLDEIAMVRPHSARSR